MSDFEWVYNNKKYTKKIEFYAYLYTNLKF